jgi:hypothetical protein
MSRSASFRIDSSACMKFPFFSLPVSSGMSRWATEGGDQAEVSWAGLAGGSCGDTRRSPTCWRHIA